MDIAKVLKLPRGPSTIAIVGGEWGDEGKGKIVDALAEQSHITVRCTGGANAGHTIVVGGEMLSLHLIPSGILHDRSGVRNIIGSGVAVHPGVLCEELRLLESRGISYKHLRIARNAHLVLPQHLVMDRVKERLRGKTKIGTTGRGIGPVYIDRLDRVGLTMVDILNVDVFKKKLEQNLGDKVAVLKKIDPAVVREVMEHPDLEGGAFYDRKDIFNVDAILSHYRKIALELRGITCDTDSIIRQAAGRQQIVLEGAQGVLLSVVCGIHPHVTSSDASLMGIAQGAGLLEREVDRTFTVVKGPYMTRVGEGVFPTEFGGKVSALWSATSGLTAEIERKCYPNASVNSPDPFKKGIGIRLAGGEFGATTGRPRRTGAIDLPIIAYALRFASREIILTKPDVLDGCEEIPVCTHYIYRGPDYDLGDRVLQAGEVLSTAIPISEVLEHVEPQYKMFPGWLSSLKNVRNASDFPKEFMDILRCFEQHTQAEVRAVSVGPEREQTVGL